MAKAVLQVGPETVEQSRIDNLALKINEICRTATLDLSYRVGELVIAELYQGNLGAWAQEGTRSVSYRKLAQRGELLMSPSALCRAVAIYTLCERMGGRALFRHLSSSHLQEVLPLPYAQQTHLLKVAEAERWPVARLRAEVAKRRPSRRRSRRSALPKIAALWKAFRGAVDENLVAGLSADPDAATKLSDLVNDAQQSLSELQRALQKLQGETSKTASETRLKCASAKPNAPRR